TAVCGAVGGLPGNPWRPDYTLRRYGVAAGGEMRQGVAGRGGGGIPHSTGLSFQRHRWRLRPPRPRRHPGGTGLWEEEPDVREMHQQHDPEEKLGMQPEEAVAPGRTRDCERPDCGRQRDGAERAGGHRWRWREAK